ncbi:MAG: ImmA/IrrE family metallo-endopeptidase [Clostridia bacterium]|nr:ImmA/IrrE family metallo-endopeptidase [Clostridia bacterium]
MSIRLSDDTYEFIKGEVVNVFERCNVNTIPIDGLELAKRLQIPLVSYSELSPKKRDAALCFSSDGFTLSILTHIGIEYRIYYNDDEIISYERRNMTMLHEIGHVVLGHRGKLVLPEEGEVEVEEDDEIEEAEAKFFAKYAASPPPLVDLISPSSSDDIANYFGLGNEASRISLDYHESWSRCKGIRNTDNEKKLVSRFGPYIKELGRDR